MLYEPIIRGLRGPCPKCTQGRLRWRGWRYRQHMPQDGRRSRDHVVYFECDRCGCRIKIFRGGLIRDAGEQEWIRYCVRPEDWDPGDEQFL